MQQALRVIEKEETIAVPNPVEAGGWHQKVEDPLDAYVDLCRRYEFKAFAVIDIGRRRKDRLVPTIEITNLVPAFLSCLEDEGPLGDCSLFQVLEQTCRPFNWLAGVNAFTGLANTKDEDTGDKEFDELLAAFDIKGGFCVPVHDPSGRRSVVVFFGDKMDGSRKRENLVMETIGVFDGANRFVAEQRVASRVHLNEQQVACLSLAAKGATIDEIADQLELSEHIVLAFLSSINEKLGTNTTAQSVAKAVNLEIISL